MRKVIFIMLLLFLAWVVQAEKLGILTDVLKPVGVEVSGKRLYVIQEATFFVYDLKSLKLITKFGKEGQGPGELSNALSIPNSLRVLDHRLMTEGLNKVILYSKDFKLLKEIKKKGIMMYRSAPLGENFVAIQMLGGNSKITLILSLFDSNMNLIKELFRQESLDRQKELVMLRDSIHFAVYKDKLYVEKSENGFCIEVFDSKGNSLFEIKKEIDTPKVSKNDKKALFNILKQDRLFYPVAQRHGGWDKFEKIGNLTYPDTFPYIQDITVTDDKIYVSTFHRKDNKEKYIIMDLQGNILSTSYLPIPTKAASFLSLSMGRENRFYGISNGNYYYLVENEAEEQWEIHLTIIK